MWADENYSLRGGAAVSLLLSGGGAFPFLTSLWVALLFPPSSFGVVQPFPPPFGCSVCFLIGSGHYFEFHHSNNLMGFLLKVEKAPPPEGERERAKLGHTEQKC